VARKKKEEGRKRKGEEGHKSILSFLKSGHAIGETGVRPKRRGKVRDLLVI